MGRSPEWGAAAGLNTEQIVALVRSRRADRLLPEPRPARTGPVQVVPTVLAPTLLGAPGSTSVLDAPVVPARLDRTGFEPRLAAVASSAQGQRRPAGASSAASLPRSGGEADGGWGEVRSPWVEPGRERRLSRIGTVPTVAAALTALAGVVLLSTAGPARPPAPRHGEQTASEVSLTTVAEWERAALPAAPSSTPAPSAAHAR